MSKRERKAADPRHREVWKLLWNYWQAEGNELVPDLPWSAADAGALALFLRANPKLSVEGIGRLLQHRLNSEDHAPGEPVRVWIGSLTRYVQGPLNKYKQLKERKDVQRTRADERNQHAADATRAALARIPGLAHR